jgi:hypothetical protein
MDSTRNTMIIIKICFTAESFLILFFFTYKTSHQNIFQNKLCESFLKAKITMFEEIKLFYYFCVST